MNNLRLYCWSGGCDSTLALYDALREQRVWTQKGKMVGEVRSIAFSHPNVPAQTQQRNARLSLLREFRRRGLVTRHIEAVVGESKRGPLYEAAAPIKTKWGSVQTQFWLGFATPFLFDGEDLVIGWHGGELDNQADVVTAFDALQRIGDKKGSLQFPLREQTYYSVVSQLKDANLLDLCWTCEGFDAATARRINLPTRQIRAGRPCGHCRKCVELKTALWQLRTFPRADLFAPDDTAKG